MKAVILQPMYLPWMGHFGLVDAADVFIFYDDVQFVERSWQRRNKIKVPNGNWIWLSVPVIKKFGHNINEVRVNNDRNWSEKHWKSITHTYSKAPYFKEYADVFEKVYKRKWDYLNDLNVTIIKEIYKLLELDYTKFIFSSKLNVEGK
ncbi:WbqC family protein [Methanothermococcus sp. SCGC AD-155-K20]|nr:WbqC family protein [Methanothermococcus sp. SCGC AD-155-K20]